MRFKHRRALRSTGALVTALTIATTMAGCSFSYGNQYAAVKTLAHAVGIGSITHVIASDTFSVGGTSPRDNIYEVVATGDITRETNVVATRLAARHYTLTDQTWHNDASKLPPEVQIIPETPGSTFTLTGNHKKVSLPQGGVLYIVSIAPD